MMVTYSRANKGKTPALQQARRFAFQYVPESLQMIF